MHNTPKESHGSQVITPTVARQIRIEETLRENDARVRHLIEHAADAFILHDPDGKILDVNQRACYSLGYTRDELLRLRVRDIEVNFDPGKLEQIWARMQRGAPVTLEGMHRRKDGSWFPVEVRVGLIEAGTGLMILALVRDITERKRAEAEQKRLMGELEDKNAELERFTYTVSHDLKSPLVTIKGFLGLLEKDTAAGDTERMKKDIRHINDAADKMQRLLAELLELSRIGRQVNPPEEVALTDLAHEAVDLVAGQIAERGVEVEIAPEMPMALGDRVRLLEVYQNLVENAVKFMGTRPAPRIEIGGQQKDGEVLCWVRDNGMGIEPQYHEKVFGLFERLAADGEGTGIGLALAKRIVEVHGGRIWVESEGRGRGSTFCFTLPPEGEGRYEGSKKPRQRAFHDMEE